jgi:hypothetical protein
LVHWWVLVHSGHQFLDFLRTVILHQNRLFWEILTMTIYLSYRTALLPQISSAILITANTGLLLPHKNYWKGSSLLFQDYWLINNIRISRIMP